MHDCRATPAVASRVTDPAHGLPDGRPRRQPADSRRPAGLSGSRRVTTRQIPSAAADHVTNSSETRTLT
jgi:hypothetical protein